MSYNRSLDGILDELRSDRMVDGVALDNLAVGDSDDEHGIDQTLPGFFFFLIFFFLIF
jgi:hypothetical protein